MAKLAQVETAAKLLWQLKATATKEVESLPLTSIDSLFETTASIGCLPSTAVTLSSSSFSKKNKKQMMILNHKVTKGSGTELDGTSDLVQLQDVDGDTGLPSSPSLIMCRGRSISMGSVEGVPIHRVTPVLSYTTPSDQHHTTASNNKKKRNHRGLLDDDDDDEDDLTYGSVHRQDNHYPSSFFLDGGLMHNQGSPTRQTTMRGVIVSPPRSSKSIKNTIILTDDLTRSPPAMDALTHHHHPSSSLPLSSGSLASPTSSTPFGTTTTVMMDMAVGSDYIKQCKRKRETFVGQETKPGVAHRATLRKKFSWKQYPELEEYLIQNQEEYFEYSAKNYTAEQRLYNNRLTNGLLDLAASIGYTFEDFTFPMIRDRLRCYFKSHSQQQKAKKRKLR